MASDNVLVRYKERQFIESMADAEAITEFDIERYFIFVEKTIVLDRGKIVASLLDGTEIECEV